MGTHSRTHSRIHTNKKKQNEDAEIQEDIDKAERLDIRFKKCKGWIKKIEKKYDTKVICIFGEFTDYLYDMFIRQLRKVEKQRRRDDWITIIIHSNGGDADIAYKIMDVMRNHKCKFCAVVPMNALSAGAEIAMNADKLIIGRYAYLSAFDTQLGNVALKNVIDVELEKCNSLKDYHKVKEAQHYKEISRRELDKMFEPRYSKEVIDKLESLFLLRPAAHENPISYKDVVDTGVTHVKQCKVKDWFHKIVAHYIDGEYNDGFRFEFYQSRI